MCYSQTVWDKIFHAFFSGPGRLVRQQTGAKRVKQFRATTVNAIKRRYENTNYAGHSTSSDPGAKEDVSVIDQLVKTIHEGIENAASADGGGVTDDAEKVRARARINDRSDQLTQVGLSSAPVVDLLGNTTSLSSSKDLSKSIKTSSLAKYSGKSGTKRGAGAGAGAKKKRTKEGDEEDGVVTVDSDDDDKRPPANTVAMLAKMIEQRGESGGPDLAGLVAEKRKDREERRKRDDTKDAAREKREEQKRQLQMGTLDIARKKEERKKKSADAKHAIKYRESIKQEKMDWYKMYKEGTITKDQLDKEIAGLNAKLKKHDEYM